MKYSALLLVLLFAITACKQADKAIDISQMTDEEVTVLANDIAQKYIITDGHVDLPYRLKVSNFRLEKEYLGIPIETDEGDFDYVRARQGGLDAPFMSIYLPARYQKEPGSSKRLADSLITMIEGIAEAHPENYQIAYTAQDCEKNFGTGVISLPMGMENGSGLEDDLSNIQYFNDRGISYVTLTHSKDNLICDSSYDTTGTWGGLSPYGKEVVAELNRVGIMVDISHVSDSTFYQVMDLTKVPVIASHSSARKFTPGFERNMNDDMIKQLGKNGGVIQINFGSSFLDKEVADRLNEHRTKLRNILREKGLDEDSEEGKAFVDQYRKDNPILLSDVQMVANHIDHVVALAGIDHVGLGSDYDGVGDTLPVGLKDVSQYPNLVKVLLQRGYSEDDISKILYKNVFRVWKAVDDYAAAQS